MLSFIYKWLKQLRLKALAKQLRKPSGTAGSKVGEMMNKANHFLYEATLAEMKLQPNESILEIGFGNGLFFEKIFHNNPNITITGLDYSSQMIKEASRLNSKRIAGNQLRLYNGNSNRLPFADNSFDKIFCINVIYFWDNLATHLQEIKRVLKPSGIFYATIRSKESMLEMPFTKYHFKLYTAEEWRALLTQQQFQFLQTKNIEEAIVQFKEQNLQLQSFCISAQK
jgi:ubiquinone/menaquinone biosynthesis C-methylase UbiE